MVHHLDPGLAEAHDRIVASLFASVTRDGAFEQVLELLAERFGCRSAALVYLDPERPRANLTIASGALKGEALAAYQRDYAAIDPLPAALARLPVGRVVATDQLFADAMAEHRRFLDEFYHRFGMRETMGGPIASEGGRSGMVAVQRGDERGAFTAQDIGAFEALVPTLAQVIGLRRAFFVSTDQARARGAVLEFASAATLLFDRFGTLDHANGFARQLLDRADGLRLDRKGRLHCLDPAAETALERLMSDPGDGRAILRVPRRDGPTPYLLRVIPKRGGAPDGFDGPIVLVSDPSRDYGPLVATLASALGLTEAGARLAAALASGQDLRGYAADAGITYNTAKFHLRSAFAATGTQRQSDLVRFVAAVLRDLALVDHPP